MDSETVDVSARVSNLTADMICLMVFGRKYGDEDMDDKGFKAVVMEALEIFDRFLEKIIHDHVLDNNKSEKKKEARDFVDTMMEILESGEAGFELDRQHIKAVLLDLFVAGMDTSATAVEWALSELIRHPTVMKKLQKELEDVVGMDHMVEESHLDGLEYLDCVIKETMRLHPVAPLLLPHQSMEDCVLDGFHVPKGSRIIVNVFAIGRDPETWVEPEKFLPERFIGSSIDVRGRDFQLLPFGSGRRGCPGLQLGLLVVRLVVAQLVHCFDWELPNGLLPGELDMSEHFGFVTARAKHLMAIPTYRLRI
ncbi:hypothetical protein RD792_004988 [Penstemon davidsonii]|uniref:Uncharacterized protein n=1 Tax=Penstemon davidsonii TaxID=160366 RepID=A0ABR0DJD9_9LAMI|nr:hypothetical protein RD792_004988 [Penstemon davidsonii]